MYIWRVNKLAKEFKENLVTEKQQLYYLLLFSSLMYIISDPYMNSLMAYGKMNYLDKLMLPTNIIIMVVGTVWCYRISQKYSGDGFLPRYICLGIPVLIKVITYFTIVFFLIYLMMLFVGDHILSEATINNYLEAECTTVVDYIGISTIEIIYFWYLGNSIRNSYV